jgi:hypothetical protein
MTLQRGLKLIWVPIRATRLKNVSFETIEPEKDNHARRKFEIGQLGGEELQEDERARDETGTGSQGNINLPSENLVTGILLLKTEF